MECVPKSACVFARPCVRAYTLILWTHEYSCVPVAYATYHATNMQKMTATSDITQTMLIHVTLGLEGSVNQHKANNSDHSLKTAPSEVRRLAFWYCKHALCTTTNLMRLSFHSMRRQVLRDVAYFLQRQLRRRQSDQCCNQVIADRIFTRWLYEVSIVCSLIMRLHAKRTFNLQFSSENHKELWHQMM